MTVTHTESQNQSVKYPLTCVWVHVLVGDVLSEGAADCEGAELQVQLLAQGADVHGSLGA